ncbi:MAG: hypothetical protein WD942_01560 [Dehalococcoidia bacterium]
MVDSRLQAVDQHLDLPVRRKVVLLRELRGDLDGMEATLQAQGFSSDDAHALAFQLLGPTRDAMADLVSLHSPWYPRLTRLIPSRSVRILEGIGIGGMAILAVLAPLQAYTRVTDLPTWVAGALGTLAVVVAAHLMWCAFRVLIREDADAASLVRAGATQTGLLALTLSVGATAVAVEAFLGAGRGLDGDVVRTARAVASSAETAALALGIGMLGLFGTWAVFEAHLLARDAEEEHRRLLDPTSPWDGGESQ